MPTPHNAGAAAAQAQISGPGDLLQAVPYLLGFHPSASLVVVGLHQRVLVVTMRMDIDQLTGRAGQELLEHALRALSRGGASEFVAAVYDDSMRLDDLDHRWLRWLMPILQAGGPGGGCVLLDLLVVVDRRWRSAGCREPGCCPAQGRPIPYQPSAFAAAATYDGIAVLPDRSALAALLQPQPESERARLTTLIADAENIAFRAALEDRLGRHDQSVERELSALARAADEPGWPPEGASPDEHDIARLGAALARPAVRDPIWVAIDERALDGRSLWSELARRLPSPYDAPALFLFGWRSWREGNGALANVAAQRALDSDSDYNAARLLLTALDHGLDPRQVPLLGSG